MRNEPTSCGRQGTVSSNWEKSAQRSILLFPSRAPDRKGKQTKDFPLLNLKPSSQNLVILSAPMTDAPTRSNLALRGSARTVAEYFEYAINSILYQRGIYPAEDFHVVRKYGLSMLVTADEDVKHYIRKIVTQLHRWVVQDKVSRLVLAVVNKDDAVVVERWQFDLQVFDETSTHAAENIPIDAGDKTEEMMQKEIQATIRQITASVTFLPALDSGDYTFNVLVYADANAKVPSEWIDSDTKDIQNAEKVKFRSFSTNSHKVDTLVSYRLGN